MGKTYDEIDGRLREFILAQPLFFVATAPSDPAGRVNLSPKGLRGTFAVLGPRRVAYLEYTGSGIETIGHLRDNGRITIMFCAFAGAPTIVRLHGRGESVLPGDAGFAALRAAFPAEEDHGVRSVIVVDVERVSDSCGFSVPYLDYVGDRDLLTRWAGNRTAEDLEEYRHHRRTPGAGRTRPHCTLGSNHGHPCVAAAGGALAVAGGPGLDPASRVRR